MKRKVLLSSLGESPAVVTEAIDKIEQEEGIRFNEVLTLGTQQDQVWKGSEILSDHIPRHYGGRIHYTPYATDAADVLDEAENMGYFKHIADLLSSYRHYNDIYVSLAGGRKTMSALVALAVQIYGAKLLCHVVHLCMDEDLQHRMSAEQMTKYPDTQTRMLHPDLDEIQLVRFPVISLFPMLNDFLSLLGEEEASAANPAAKELLLESGFIAPQAGGWRPTALGLSFYDIINDIEMLPNPCSVNPREKPVVLHGDHHGNNKLRPLAEALRYFPYAEGVNSTDFRPYVNRAGASNTKYGHLLLENVAGAENELRLVLAGTDAGYTLSLRTSARTANQNECVRRELLRFLGA